MDLTTDSILFLFLFILPGALAKILISKFSYRDINEENQSSLTETSKVIVFSSFVFLINMIIEYMYNKTFSTENIINNSSKNDYLIRYIIITIVITIVTTFIYEKFQMKFINKISNIHNIIANKPRELQYKSIWDNLFKTNNIINFKNEERVVEITKGDTLIVRGILKTVSSPDASNQDLILMYSDIIESYFKRDKKSSNNNKIFNEVDFVYYSISHDIKLTFYNMEKYNRLIESECN